MVSTQLLTNGRAAGDPRAMSPVGEDDVMSTTDDRSFSPEALKEKYRQEREKRLRSEGNAQYLRIHGRLRRL